MRIINNDIIDTIIGLADQEIQSCYEVARRDDDKDLELQADSAASALAHATPLLKAAPETASERDKLKVIKAELLDTLEYLESVLSEQSEDTFERELIRIRAAIAKAKEKSHA